jgi:hypothetical protein
VADEDVELESMQRVAVLLNELAEVEKRRSELFLQVVQLFPEVASEAAEVVTRRVLEVVTQPGWMAGMFEQAAGNVRWKQ